jgi:K+-sensing histidine kinase KdpD
MLDFKNENLHLLAVVVNNTKGFIIVGVIASILSALFSSALFIDPKYKFSAII